MLAFVQRGLTLSQAQRKQRVRNAGWYLNVYRPEVARLKRSIGKLFKDNVKLLIRDKQVTKEYDNLSKVITNILRYYNQYNLLYFISF